MKRGSWKIAAFIIVLAAVIVISINPLKNNLQLGLDLKGGAEIVLQAIPNEGESEITAEDMTQLKEMMRKRVDSIGVSEPVIQLEGNDRLIVDLAGVDNPEQAIELVGKTAKLEFRDPAGNVILSGSDLVDAKGVTQNGEAVISLKFSDDGTKKFAEATSAFVGQKIGIYLDDKLLTDPKVDEPILTGEAVISGSYTLDSAIAQASILKGGALPVNVEILSKRAVGPSLGADSLQKSMYAGLIGMILLLIFIIVYYRLPGFIAAISLVAYTLLLLWSIDLVGVVLTLPGIAGFVLSIGMAVDANIIIYERLREELRNGKSLRGAINAGFKRAMWTILDSNITTLLAAAVLFKFGTGSVQGFAVTLSIGIVISMFTALVITRYLLQWSADVPAFSNRLGLYGKGGDSNEK